MKITFAVLSFMFVFNWSICQGVWNMNKDIDGLEFEIGLTTISAYKLVPFNKNVPNRGSFGGQFLGVEIISLIPISKNGEGSRGINRNLPINFSYHILNLDWSANLNGDMTEKSDAGYLRVGICPKVSLYDYEFAGGTKASVNLGANFGWGLAWTNIKGVDNTDGFQSGIDISISLSVNLSQLVNQ